MTYQEAERYIEQNRDKINDKVSEYKFMGLVTASNTAETREKERIFKEVFEKGVDNNIVLRDSGGINSDLNVFFIGQSTNGGLGTMLFSDYLRAISQREL